MKWVRRDWRKVVIILIKVPEGFQHRSVVCRSSLVGWNSRPSLVGWRPLLLGWRPSKAWPKVWRKALNCS